MSDLYTKKKNKNNKKQLNIGIIICVLILLYLVVSFCIYFFGSRTLIVEVTQGTTANKFEGQYTGLILREETVVNANNNGYIIFFVGDGNTVHVNEKTYVIDSNGSLTSKIEEAAKNQSILSEDNLLKIKNSIYDFDTSFNSMNYYDVYNFKYKVDSQIMDLINGSVFSDFNSDISSNAAYSIYSSEIAGDIIHNIDGFENFKIEDIGNKSFKKSEYNKNIIKSGDLIKKDSPVYKVVTSQDWKIVFQINNPKLFEGLDELNIEFLKDGVETYGPFEMFTKSGNTYGVLSLNKYMIRYLTDRYVQIQILDDTKKGLKIPKTAVTEKQFYAIPLEYLSQGGNSSSDGFNKQIILDDGSTSIQFVSADIVKRDEENCYVSIDTFNDGDVLVMNETNSLFKVGHKENIQGVFVVNNGFTNFKRIEIIGESNSSYIVLENLSGGISLYDRVVSNAEGVKDGEVINR